MSFKVLQNKSMARNLHRLFKSQCTKAIQHLECFTSDPEDSVHQARIVFKKIRTILRLIRRGLDKPTYQYFNYAFRDLGLRLSIQRDNWVKQQTLSALQSEQGGSLNTITHRVTADDKESVEAVLKRLFELRDEVAALTIRPKGFKLIRKSAMKIYRDGKTAMECARASGHDEDFHEWRKSAKHYYHLIAILQPIQPLELKPLRDELYSLSLLLGEDHDLSLLKDEAIKKADRKLEQQISSRQKAKRSQAFELADRLFADCEGEFSQRLESNWQVFRQPVKQDLEHIPESNLV